MTDVEGSAATAAGLAVGRLRATAVVAPRRVALVGPSGGGKTTTLAKLAAHFKLRAGRRVALKCARLPV